MTVVDSGVSDSRSQPWQFWLPLAFVVLLIKLLLYWYDSDVMFFLGDSATYLHTASSGWIPPDRSWVYGSLIRRVTLGATHLELLVVFQVLVSALSCLVLGFILRRFFACSLPLVAVAVVANSFEPIQLLFERYVMAETVSLLAFALFLVAVLSYLRPASQSSQAQWWWLAIMTVLAVSAGALRTSYLPVTMGVSLLAIVYCGVAGLLSPSSSVAGGSPWSRRLGRSAAHLLIFALLWSALSWVEGRHRPYTDKGYFLLSAWGPVLAQPDYPKDDQLSAFIKDLPEDCELSSLVNRVNNLWFPDCLASRIKDHFGPGPDASDYARGVALDVLTTDPVGILGLGYQTWATLWDDYVLPSILYVDRGGSPSPPQSFTLQLRDDWGLENAGWHFRKTLTNQYFFAATDWYRWVILVPLLMPLWWLLSIRQLSPASLVVTAAGILMLLVVTIPVTVISVRFYHGIAWLTILVSVSSLDRIVWLLRRQFGRRRDNADEPGTADSNEDRARL